MGERKHLTEAELKAAILPELKFGFFRLKVSTLQQQLLLLPWIKQVNIRKVWPDQLVVTFEEHTPVAFWGQKGLISESGKLLYPDMSRSRFPKMPILEGPESKYTLVWQQYLVMKEALTPHKLSINQLVLAPRGAWHMKLSNGMTVVLGTNDLITRLQRFIHAYEKSLKVRSNDIAYVDLRYTSGMAVGWKTG